MPDTGSTEEGMERGRQEAVGSEEKRLTGIIHNVYIQSSHIKLGVPFLASSIKLHPQGLSCLWAALIDDDRPGPGADSVLPPRPAPAPLHNPHPGRGMLCPLRLLLRAL